MKWPVLLAVFLAVMGAGVPSEAREEVMTGATGFRVMAVIEQVPRYKPIPGARIRVIGPDGRLMSTGLTNAHGKWPIRMTVPVDRRNGPSRTLGTVTAIAVTDGYVERLFFDVPVAPEGAVHVMSLQPIEGDWNSSHWTSELGTGAFGRCIRITEHRIPPEAARTALAFIEALYSYDIERILELAEPSKRNMLAKEAFNGPNAEPVRVTGAATITRAETCAWRRLRLTVLLPAEYMKGQQTHMIRLTLRPPWGKWLITDMAADYDVR